MYKQTKRVQYNQANMAVAISMVRGGMAKARAAKLYGVPRSTLQDKLNGRVPEEATRPGPVPVLTEDEERTLVMYTKRMADIGYPLTRKELMKEVKRTLDMDRRKTPFKDNLPGRGWFKAFSMRNPDLTERTPALLGHQRALISNEKINGWYEGLDAYLQKEVPNYIALINDPRQIFNADESGFPLSMKAKKVLAPKGASHVYQVLSSDKTQITVMACFNAFGNYMPPLIVYTGQRFRDTILSGFPEALYGHSANGWMDGELFTSFVHHFHDYVTKEKITLPVILFVDGHSTHISLRTAKFCSENGIILYCLLENATHVLQACDIGLFSPMKTKWRESVKEWQMQHLGEVFTKSHFPEVFKSTWESVTTLEISINSFRRSGLFPLTPKGIDTSKLGPSKMCCTVDSSIAPEPLGANATAAVAPGPSASVSEALGSNATVAVALRPSASVSEPLGSNATVAPGHSVSVSEPLGSNATVAVTPGHSASVSEPFGFNATVAVAPGPSASVSEPFGFNATVAVTPGPSASVSEPLGFNATVAVTPGHSASVSEPLGINATVAVTPGPSASVSEPFGFNATVTVTPGPSASASEPLCSNAIVAAVQSSAAPSAVASVSERRDSILDTTSNQVSSMPHYASAVPIILNRGDPTYVSPAFQMLRVPEPKPKKKVNTLRSKLPKSLSGTDALKMLREREENKLTEESAKQRRKEEREIKRRAKEEDKEQKRMERELKKKRKLMEKRKKIIDESDSEIENIPYMDESDYDEGEICPGCKSTEGRQDEWLGCGRCPRWWHIECIDRQDFNGKHACELKGVSFECEMCSQ